MIINYIAFVNSKCYNNKKPIKRIMYKISKEWDEFLQEEFSSPTYLKLREFLKQEYSSYTIYPSMYDIFNSMKKTCLDKVKVVIIGQDPYHEEGQAMGLSFSVPKGQKIPPSLVNIYKEIQSETGLTMPPHGELTGWAEQGVLLLNAVLTVREHLANSHKNKGWEEFTDGVIKKLSSNKKGIVFMLWGANARSKKCLIDQTKHLVLESAHPSPLSAYNGFFGNGHFNKANEYLKSIGSKPIDWSKL